jgi:hypothetical protein
MRLAWWLFGALAFAVYLTNLRPMGSGDTITARLLPFSIVREGNFDLNEFEWLRPDGYVPYFLRRSASGHWYSKYPVATPLVVSPLAVPVVWWLEAKEIADADARFRLAAAVFERIAAAMIAAVSVALVYAAACSLCSPRIAALMTLAYAFATGTWSVSSQALWQHGLAQLSLAAVSLIILNTTSARGALLVGAFAALGVAARPMMAIFAAIAFFFFWRERRRQLMLFCAAPAVTALLLVCYNFGVLGRATGGYTTGGVSSPSLSAFLGLLLSPNRGLFVYTPLALFALPGLFLRDRRSLWLLYLAITIAAYVAFFSCFRIWWGGHCYGPRYFVDILPALILCAAPTVERLWKGIGWRTLILASTFWGVAVQAIGVYCDDNDWNLWPINVDQRPLRVWDWSDPQILRAARSGWHGFDFAPLLWQLAYDPRPALLKPLNGPELQGEIAASAPVPWHFRAGRRGALDVRVTNRSDTMWPAFSDFGDQEVGLLLAWRLNEQVLKGVGGFVRLPLHLGPGESTRVRRWVEVPGEPESYELEVMIVQNIGEGLGRSGGASLTIPVVVGSVERQYQVPRLR